MKVPHIILKVFLVIIQRFVEFHMMKVRARRRRYHEKVSAKQNHITLFIFDGCCKLFHLRMRKLWNAFHSFRILR